MAAKPKKHMVLVYIVVICVSILICVCVCNIIFQNIGYTTFIPKFRLKSEADMNIDVIQDIIDKYVSKLSQQDYSRFNGDIYINEVKFNHLSVDYIYSVMHKKSFISFGDSLCRSFTIFLLYTMYQLNHNDTHTLNVDLNNDSLIWPSSLRGMVDLNAWNDWNGTSSKAVEFIRSSPTLDGAVTIRKIFELKHSQISFVGFSVKRSQQSWVRALQRFINETVTESQFDQVIFTDFSSMHFTHLYPSRPFEGNSFQHIINFESIMTEMLNVIIMHNTTKCVIFRPPNPVCISSYNKAYAPLGVFYEQQAPFLNHTESQKRNEIKKCLNSNHIEVDKIYYQDNSSNLTMSGMDICSKYTLTSVGSQLLNERMRVFVLKHQKEIYDTYGLKLIYYDQFKLFEGRCNYTEDGRHFPALLPAEAMALFNVIEKWC